jgi:hypothetical protein
MNPKHVVNLFFALALPICFALAGCSSQSAPQAQDGNKNQGTQGNAGTDGKDTKPSKAGAATASAQKEARDALAKFDKEWKPGDRPGTWKVRMECLQALVKAGEGAVPILVEALKSGSNHHHRGFAAQALGFIGDPNARPALLEALKEENEFVRIHVLMALGRFGRLEATPAFRDMAEKNAHDDVRFLMSYALTRDDKPDPKPIRQALIDYDLTRMGSARQGKAAPDFTLADTQGKTWRLTELRGKKSVVLVFLMGYT